MSSYCKVWINNQEIEADPERKLMEVLRDVDGLDADRSVATIGAARREILRLLKEEER